LAFSSATTIPTAVAAKLLLIEYSAGGSAPYGAHHAFAMTWPWRRSMKLFIVEERQDGGGRHPLYPSWLLRGKPAPKAVQLPRLGLGFANEVG
jgi:hypothetical protein